MARRDNAATAASDRFATIVIDALSQGRTVRFRATGDSMRPAILDGDVIRVRPVAAAAVSVGDILLCRPGSRLLVHRLIALDDPAHGRRYYLRGDAARACDAPVRAGEILGRVDAVYRTAPAIRGGIADILRACRRRFSGMLWPSSH